MYKVQIHLDTIGGDNLLEFDEVTKYTYRHGGLELIVDGHIEVYPWHIMYDVRIDSIKPDKSDTGLRATLF